MEAEIINNKFGKAFPPAMAFSGYVILAAGIVLMWENFWYGLLIAVVGGLICFTKSGVLIDCSNKRYKDYSSFYGIKQGKWESVTPYPFIAILHRNISTTAFSQGNRPGTTGSNIYYDIFLLNNTHRKKVLIKRLKDKEGAITEAKELAVKLDLEMTNYNPVVSSKTRVRRYKGRK